MSNELKGPLSTVLPHGRANWPSSPGAGADYSGPMSGLEREGEWIQNMVGRWIRGFERVQASLSNLIIHFSHHHAHPTLHRRLLRNVNLVIPN